MPSRRSDRTSRSKPFIGYVTRVTKLSKGRGRRARDWLISDPAKRLISSSDLVLVETGFHHHQIPNCPLFPMVHQRHAADCRHV
jgi:hypothetical protein